MTSWLQAGRGTGAMAMALFGVITELNKDRNRIKHGNL
jgi:hypothetical protein